MRAFAQAGALYAAREPLGLFARLAAELPDGVDAAGLTLSWEVQGELRAGARGGEPTIWLHLQVQATLPLSCQRCLAPVDTNLVVDRWFRFVSDEAEAEAEDEDSEEDVLALEPRPSLRELIEDELLMELPLLPMHDRCPEVLLAPLAPVSGAQDGEAPRRNPFAELAKLKK